MNEQYPNELNQQQAENFNDSSVNNYYSTGYQQQPYQNNFFQNYPNLNQQQGYPTYYQQQTHFHQPVYPKQIEYSKGTSIASLVLGIVSLVISWAMVLFPVAILGIVFGVDGQKKAKAVGTKSGLATGGLVCSIIGASSCLIWIIVFFCFAAALEKYGIFRGFYDVFSI